MGANHQSGIFVWNEYKSWRGTILRLLADLIDKKVFAKLKRNPPRYFVSDDLGWLDGAIEQAKGILQPEISRTLCERLSHRYPFVRAFHGCRPDSTRPYLERGVVPSDPAALNRLAYEIFSRKERVGNAIEDLAKPDLGTSSYRDHNKGKVFFCLQMEHLVKDCGHYLLYGSEYLKCLASYLGEPEALRRRGRATVIECNVPIADIPIAFVQCLVGEILREICEKYCDRTYQSAVLHFGFHISNTLKPRNIVAFHFPTGIPNPLNFNRQED